MEAIDWLVNNAESVYQAYQNAGKSPQSAYELMKSQGISDVMEFDTFNIHVPIFVSVYERYAKQPDADAIKNRIESLENRIETLEQTAIKGNKVKQRQLFKAPTGESSGKLKVGKWGVFRYDKYYRAFRTFDGKQVGIYIGSNPDPAIVEQKIKAKGLPLN